MIRRLIILLLIVGAIIFYMNSAQNIRLKIVI